MGTGRGCRGPFPRPRGSPSLPTVTSSCTSGCQIQAQQPAARDGQLGGFPLPWPHCLFAPPSQPLRLSRARIPQPLALCPPAGGHHGGPRAWPAAPCSGWASGGAGPRNTSGLPRLRAPLALSAGDQLAQLLQCHGTGSTGSNAEVGGRRCPLPGSDVRGQTGTVTAGLGWTWGHPGPRSCAFPCCTPQLGNVGVAAGGRVGGNVSTAL